MKNSFVISQIQFFKKPFDSISLAISLCLSCQEKTLHTASNCIDCKGVLNFTLLSVDQENDNTLSFIIQYSISSLAFFLPLKPDSRCLRIGIRYGSDWVEQDQNPRKVPNREAKEDLQTR